jgi:SnoaL-like polyketide cyclase
LLLPAYLLEAPIAGGLDGRSRDGKGSRCAACGVGGSKCADVKEAFPDFQVIPTRTIEEGSAVGFHGRVTGTHQGTLRTPNGDIPATGRRVDFTIGGDCDIQDRQIVSMRLHFDRLEILEQLGVAPVSAPTA